MFKRQTVFVIGAGCSKELGLPLGPGLRDEIYQHVNDARRAQLTGPFVEALMSSGIRNITVNMYRKVDQFYRGLHAKPSIDQYIDFHQDDDELVGLGKMALAYALLRAECRSLVTPDVLKDGMGALKDTWLLKLFHLMNDGTRRDEPENIFRNVSFVCFNYDRCIEAFFFTGIQQLSHCSARDAVEVIENGLRIVHPYGVVAPLDLKKAASSGRLDFGLPDLIPYLIQGVQKRVRTFTEGMADDDDQQSIGHQLESAEQVIFLGTSFLDQNMRLISSGEASRASSVYATTFGLSEANEELARGRVVHALDPAGHSGLALRAKMIPLTAGSFLDDYGPSISG